MLYTQKNVNLSYRQAELLAEKINELVKCEYKSTCRKAGVTICSMFGFDFISIQQRTLFYLHAVIGNGIYIKKFDFEWEILKSNVYTKPCNWSSKDLAYELRPSKKHDLDAIFTDVFVATRWAQYCAVFGNGAQIDFNKHCPTNAIQVLFSCWPRLMPVTSMLAIANADAVEVVAAICFSGWAKCWLQRHRTMTVACIVSRRLQMVRQCYDLATAQRQEAAFSKLKEEKRQQRNKPKWYMSSHVN